MDNFYSRVLSLGLQDHFLSQYRSYSTECKSLVQGEIALFASLFIIVSVSISQCGVQRL